jgi:hypothetical protein
MVCLVALVGTHLLIAQAQDQHPSILVRRTALAFAIALFMFVVIAILFGGTAVGACCSPPWALSPASSCA